jgi:hypothetical protein
MIRRFLIRISLAASLLAWIGGCDRTETPTSLSVSPQSAPSLAVHIEVAAPTEPSAPVAVAIRTTGEEPLRAIQGTLIYDPRSLRLVGPDPAGPVVLVHEASPGHLSLLSFDPVRLPERAAVFRFERVAGGVGGLRWEHDIAVTTSSTEVERTERSVEPRYAADLQAPGVEGLLADGEWVTRLARRWGHTVGEGPAGVPGEMSRDLVFGDVNLDCELNFTDVTEIARFSVSRLTVARGSEGLGQQETEVPPCGADRGLDRAVASNVVPANLPGLGGAGDACGPGVDLCPSGVRRVNASDVVAIAREIVGLEDHPVVGERIPGRRAEDLPADAVVRTGIVGDVTWTPDQVQVLRGTVRVRGGTLTIEPGTFIVAESDTSRLIVERDGRIVAAGSFLEPIRFTCVFSESCVWPGITILGNGPVEGGTPTSPVLAGRVASGGCSEVGIVIQPGVEDRFGGCAGIGGEPADSSGILRYVVVDDVSPGLRLLGVGAGTRVESVQVHESSTRGLHLAGGDVDLRRILVTAASDTAISLEAGWRGRAQHVIGQVRDLAGGVGLVAGPGSSSGGGGELWNVSTLATGGDSLTKVGVIARPGANVRVGNLLVDGALGCADIDDGGSAVGPVLTSTGVPVRDCTGAFTAPGPLLISALSPDNPDFTPPVSGAVETTSCASPPSDGWFESGADRCGAVQPELAGTVPWWTGWSLARHPSSRGGLKPEVPGASVLVVLSGDGQVGPPGATLDPLAVEVRNVLGAPKASVTVDFTVTEGGCTVAPAQTQTSGDGRASSEVMLPSAPGTCVIAVSAPGAPSAEVVVEAEVPTLAFGSDIDFVAWRASTGFTQYFNGALHWGRNQIPSADWELAVRTPADMPLVTPAQHLWSQDALAPDTFSLRFERPGTITLRAEPDSSRATPPGVYPPVDALFIRARASAGVAAEIDFTVRLLSGEIVNSGSVSGDADAAYVGVVDERLDGGFLVEGTISLLGGGSISSADPAVQIQVGATAGT